jgi:hypothetical protein
MASRTRAPEEKVIAEAPKENSIPVDGNKGPVAPVAPPTPTPILPPVEKAAEAPARHASAPETAETAPSGDATPSGAAAETNGDKSTEATVASPSGVDRAQVARELASLGVADEKDNGNDLTRDGDVNKGLLLRLIDGVKGA